MSTPAHARNRLLHEQPGQRPRHYPGSKRLAHRIARRHRQLSFLLPVHGAPLAHRRHGPPNLLGLRHRQRCCHRARQSDHPLTRVTPQPIAQVTPRAGVRHPRRGRASGTLPIAARRAPRPRPPATPGPLPCAPASPRADSAPACPPRYACAPCTAVRTATPCRKCPGPSRTSAMGQCSARRPRRSPPSACQTIAAAAATAASRP